MALALLLAVVTAGFTAAGGALALRSKDRLHLVLGLAAGLLLGLVAFDLLPEIFELNAAQVGGVPLVALLLVGGFLVLHIAEHASGVHEPAESDYGHSHNHSHHVAGTIGAIAMAGHIFLDGLALGVAFQLGNALGFAVFIAMNAHAFSDGLNTVSLLIKSGHWSKKASYLLTLDVVMRVGGAAVGSYILFSDQALAMYLAIFAGIVIYLSTSHILPEAHARHSSRFTLLSIVAGVGAMWVIVGALG